MTHYFTQHPAELVDYTITWASALAPSDTIISSSWQVQTSGITTSLPSYTSATTTIWVTGGLIDAAYEVVNTVTTAGGRIYQDSITITMADLQAADQRSVTVTSSGAITLVGDMTGSGTGVITTTLANTAVTAGSYTNTNLTVDAKGRILLASNGSGGSGSPGGSSGQIQYNNSGTFAGFTANGDATITTSTGAVTVTGLRGHAVKNALPTDAQLMIWNNTNSDWEPVSMSGDATIANTGVIAVTKTGGVAFAASATTNTTTTANITDSTNKRFVTDAALTVLGNTSGTNSGDITVTGQNYITLAGQAITVNAVNLSGSNVTSTLPESRGGTNQSTYALGDILYSSATNTLGKLSGNITGTKKYLSQTGTGTVSAAPAWAQVAAADISGLAASATTDTTNAANISSGTLPAARLPNPSATTLGGVESYATVSHQFLTSISTSGVPASAQPAASDITGLAASATTDTTNAANISSGTLPAGRLPNPSASTLGGVQSAAAVSHQWINSISTSGVPSLSQPSTSDISGLGTIATQAASSVAITGGIIDGATLGGATPMQAQVFMPTNPQSGTTYSTVLSDTGKYLRFTSASAVTLTITKNATVAAPINAEIVVMQAGAGKVSPVADTGVTLNFPAGVTGSSGQYAAFTMKQIATNTWDVFGNLA